MSDAPRAKKPRRRMTPTERLEFERACSTIAFALLFAAIIIARG